ncbi:MAG: hypothetical protein Q8R88_12740, partial [Desulfoprunum sp.]|nr:hypothetical protein [Desulfoprunum sp.]
MMSPYGILAANGKIPLPVSTIINAFKKGEDHAQSPLFSQRTKRQTLKAFQTDYAQVGRKI